ncbi:MAG: hypothetical protein NTU49_09885 [Gammaproteobacteria bacterium]|nr:hypothetical protein [Gammaproteobacteria bacterium]
MTRREGSLDSLEDVLLGGNTAVQPEILAAAQDVTVVQVGLSPASSVSSIASPVILRSPRSLSANIAFYVADSLRNGFVFHALISESLNTVYGGLAPHHWAPSQKVQETWGAIPIAGTAAMMSISAELLNYFYEKKNPGKYLGAYDYFASFLAPAFLLFISQLVSGDAMSFQCFVGLTAGFWILSAFLQLKFKLISPESSDQFMLLPYRDKQFNPLRFVDAKLMERILNVIRIGIKTIFAWTVFAATVSREVNGKTEELSPWLFELIGLCFLATGPVGYELTHHPKFAQGYVMFLAMLEQGSLTYRAMSGLLFLIVVYSCSDQKFCANDSQRDALTHLCFFTSLLVGLFATATTRFDFLDNDKSNKKIIKAAENAPDVIREKAGAMVDAISNCSNPFSGCGEKVSDCFSGFVNKISSCCSRAEVLPETQNENSSLMAAAKA